MGFRRGKGGIAVTFGNDEPWLRQVLADMLVLLGPTPEPEQFEDPLQAALAVGTNTEPPADPALARLFPDAYRDDPEAAADFRRYTEPGLRAAKAEALRTALATLSADRVVLTAEQAQAWLRALNDTRLVLGERLQITEDWEEQAEALDEDDPLLLSYAIYERLTYLQESLVHALWAAS